jgi:hypothetical protein
MSSAPGIASATNDLLADVDEQLGKIEDEVVAIPNRDSYERQVAASSLKPQRKGNRPDKLTAAPFPTVRLLEGSPPEPPAVHIERQTLDRELNLVAANGGSGKSTCLFAVTVSVVLGIPLFGSLTVNRSGPVLLVIPEDGQSAARMMLDALVEGLSLDANARKQLAEGVVMIPDTEVVSILHDTHRLQQTALDTEAVMMIGDPLRTLLGGEDENDNAIASRTCDTIRRALCRDADLTVILATHNRKPTRDAESSGEVTAHDVRGGGGWVNGSRLTLGVSKKQSRITITGLKANRIDPETLRHELELSIEADPKNAARWLSCRLTDANAGTASATLTPGRGRSLNANETAALKALDNPHEPGRRCSWSSWRETSGLKENTFKSVKDRLLDARLARAIPTGGKTRSGAPEYAYELSDEGRLVLVTGRLV